jgi:hypothetical protein
MDQDEIRLQLREESRVAWEIFADASKRFEEAKWAVPRGVPFPDDVRIAASREYTEALRAHREAAKLAYEFAVLSARI